MDPQLPQPNPYVQYQQPRAPRSKAWLWVLLGIILLAGTAAGVYFWQQGQVDAARREKDLAVQQAQQQQQEPAEPEPAKFEGPKVPFTFSYPSSWALQSNAPVTYDNALPDSYVTTLAAPGTKEVGMPSGGSELKSGATITVSVSAKPGVKTLAEATVSLPGEKPTPANVTVSGQPAIEYEYGYEGPKRLYTQVLKDGIMYTFMFEVQGTNLKGSEHYKAYQDLVKSFAFK